MTIRKVHDGPPSRFKVDEIITKADRLEQQLKHKVLVFEEDYDLIVLAREIKRLRQLITIP